MNKYYLFCLVFSALSFTGCGIGGWWMEGNPRAAHIEYRPQVAYWISDGKDYFTRQKDWLKCGGDDGGEVKLPLPTGNIHNDYAVANKKYDDAQYCMMKKGYHYVGSCRGPSGLRFACRKK